MNLVAHNAKEEIKKLSDQTLWDLTKSKVQAERNLTLEIIDLLREISSRKLHIKRRYSSLHEYCVKELKYDDGEAHRKIKALNLVTQIPEVVQSLEKGTLSLTTASQVQNFFEQEAKKDKPYTKEAKIELLAHLESKSKREVEKALKTLAPETLKQTEKINYVSETHVKLEIIIEEKLLKKIERLKNLTSHKNSTIKDLIESLVDQELKKKDPEVKKVKNESQKNVLDRRKAQSQMQASPEKLKPEKVNESAKIETEKAENRKITTQRSRYIQAQTNRQVWILAKSQCTFIDPLSGQRCEAKRFLQIEHKFPYAMGGSSEISNLTLLCSNHNKLKAVQFFGERKISNFIKNVT